MATVTELSDPYANFMLGPLPPSADDVCGICLTFTDGWATCYPFGHQARFADAVLPISYSVAFSQTHTALQQYKRGHAVAARCLQYQLAAVLWRFLALHESCLAGRAGVDAFDLVTTVSSSSPERDATHPLRRLVGELVVPTRTRHRRLLIRSGTPFQSEPSTQASSIRQRIFSASRFSSSTTHGPRAPASRAPRRR